MKKMLIVIPSYNIISTRNEQCLYNSIDSIVKAYLFFQNKFPNVEINCNWVDDASTDGTYGKVVEIINSYEPDIAKIFETFRLAVNKGAAFCRNYAVSLKKADYICFLDADDEMLKDHLVVCYNLINKKDEEGKKAAIGITKALFDEKYSIHESWKNHLCLGFPMTKIIRYDVFDFVEGFPTKEIYRTTGGEDFELAYSILKFFKPILTNKQTIKYNIYENSTMWKRLDAYKEPREEYSEYLKKDPVYQKEYNKNNKNKNKIGKDHLKYLKYKFKKLGFKDKFSDLIISENF